MVNRNFSPVRELPGLEALPGILKDSPPEIIGDMTDLRIAYDRNDQESMQEAWKTLNLWKQEGSITNYSHAIQTLKLVADGANIDAEEIGEARGEMSKYQKGEK